MNASKIRTGNSRDGHTEGDLGKMRKNPGRNTFNFVKLMSFWDYTRPGIMLELEASSETIDNNYTNNNQNTRVSNNRESVLVLEVDLTVRSDHFCMTKKS